MKKLGELIKELRGRESLRDASKRIGISHTYLDTLEKGYDKRSNKPVKPTPETLKLIADAYNYPYENLMELAGYLEEEEEEFEAFIKDPSLKIWYKELPKSKEEDLQMLREIFEAFKKRKE